MRRTAVVVAVSFLAACAVAPDGGEPAESIGQTHEALSAYDWTPDKKAGDNQASAGGSIARFGAVIQMVHQGAGVNDQSLWASAYDGSSWSDDKQMSGHYSKTTPSLAEFNSHLYMFRNGFSTNDVWMSRFDTSTKTWPAAVKTPYLSSSSPGIIEFHGQLVIVGVTPGTNQLWQATMTSAEHFVPPTLIPGQFSDVAPSVATNYSFGAGILAMTYLAVGTTKILISQQPVNGGEWGAPQPIPGFTRDQFFQSRSQPALIGAYLTWHLVFSGVGSDDQVYWSYADYGGSTWSLPVGLPAQKMFGGRASLTTPTPNANELGMVHPSSLQDHNDGTTQIYYSAFQ